MKSLEYYLGFVVGIAISAIILLMLRKKFKRKFGHAEYDERQKSVRGECYKIAFWVLVGYLAVNGLFSNFTGIVWGDPFMMTMSGVYLAIGVFIVLCIRKDAYFTMNEQPRFYKRLFLVLVPIVAGTGVVSILTGEGALVENGQLTSEVISFEVAALLLAILITLHTRKEPQEDMEDADE